MLADMLAGRVCLQTQFNWPANPRSWWFSSSSSMSLFSIVDGFHCIFVVFLMYLNAILRFWSLQNKIIETGWFILTYCEFFSWLELSHFSWTWKYHSSRNHQHGYIWFLKMVVTKREKIASSSLLTTAAILLQHIDTMFWKHHLVHIQFSLSFTTDLSQLL